MIPSSLVCESCGEQMVMGVSSKEAKFCDRCGRVICSGCAQVAGEEALAHLKWCKVCRAEREVLGGNLPQI